jgi:hypothetical protein
VKPPHVRPMPGPSLRQCGNPACAICSRNIPGEPPDSGHPAGEESLASLLVGAAFIVMALVFVLFLLPVLAS